MWKRNEAVSPDSGADSAAAGAAGRPAPAPAQDTTRKKDVANIGKSVVIKGELNGSEDLTIDGQVEGKIELRQHVLTIGPNGHVRADVRAKAVVVLGRVEGNTTAGETVDIRVNGSVEGDIVAPRVAVADGAYFRGSIDMQPGGAEPAAHARTPPMPAGSNAPDGPRPSRPPAKVG